MLVADNTKKEKMKLYQWLNAYERITKREFHNEISEAERARLRKEYADYLNADY